MDPDSSATDASCDPAMSGLRGDLADLAVPLAGEISSGESWIDSVTTEICVSGVPGTARTSRRYLAIGDSSLAEEPVFIVTRRDSTLAEAHGVFDQHTVSIAADGISTARIYLSQVTGRVLRVSKTQELRIKVGTASGARQFVQKTTGSIEADR